MVQGLRRDSVPVVVESIRDHAFLSFLLGSVAGLAVLAVGFELINMPVVAALTAAFAILFAILSVIFVIIPVSALSLMD